MYTPEDFATHVSKRKQLLIGEKFLRVKDSPQDMETSSIASSTSCPELENPADLSELEASRRTFAIRLSEVCWF